MDLRVHVDAAFQVLGEGVSEDGIPNPLGSSGPALRIRFPNRIEKAPLAGSGL